MAEPDRTGQNAPKEIHHRRATPSHFLSTHGQLGWPTTDSVAPHVILVGADWTALHEASISLFRLSWRASFLKTLRSATKRTARRSDTEKDILRAAEKLLKKSRIGELNYDALMMEAGLTRTAFYRYFPDMASLVLRLYDEVRAEIEVSALTWKQEDIAPVEALEQSLKAIVESYVQHGAVLRAVAEASALDSEIESAYKKSADAFIENVRDFMVRNRKQTIVDKGDEAETAAALVWMTERFCTRELVTANSKKIASSIRVLTSLWKRALYGA